VKPSVETIYTVNSLGVCVARVRHSKLYLPYAGVSRVNGCYLRCRSRRAKFRG